jgi:hypothetical protein
MDSKRLLAILACFLIGSLNCSQALLAPGAGGAPSPAESWPREVNLANAKALIYQPADRVLGGE